jgi:predicted glycosyltransferase
VTAIPFVQDLPTLFAACDVAVTMGGYSTIAELFASEAPAVVVPRAKPWPEQLLRAERLAALALIRMIHPDELTPVRLAEDVAIALRAGRSRGPVACDGAANSAAALLRLLDSVIGQTSLGTAAAREGSGARDISRL